MKSDRRELSPDTSFEFRDFTEPENNQIKEQT